MDLPLLSALSHQAKRKAKTSRKKSETGMPLIAPRSEVRIEASAYGLTIKNRGKKVKKKPKHLLKSYEKNKSRKRQRSETNDDDTEEEPLGLFAGLSSKRNGGGDGSKHQEKPTKLNSSLGVKTISKKDFNSAFAVTNEFAVPLTLDEEQKRKDRQMRFASSNPPELSSTEDAVHSALSSPRFFNANRSAPKKKRRTASGSKIGVGSEAFIGTSQNLEKPYLRLTSFPKAEDVRPLPVLKQAFEHIKKKYRENEDFPWANEQLKSLRQDLTVQGLRNAFVLEVYEVHARLSLEEGELNEFNQCQTMIKSLTMGMSESKADVSNCFGSLPSYRDSFKLLKQTKDAADEFAAYRLLYALVQKEPGAVNRELFYANSMAAKDYTSMHDMKGQSDRMSSCEHGMLVAKAVLQCDYHSFFILYDNAPNMSAYLMDFLVQRVRSNAFQRIISAYRPTLSVEFFRETLFFHDLEETRGFLKKVGAKFVKDMGGSGPPFWVDCKASR